MTSHGMAGGVSADPEPISPRGTLGVRLRPCSSLETPCKLWWSSQVPPTEQTEGEGRSVTLQELRLDAFHGFDPVGRAEQQRRVHGDR